MDAVAWVRRICCTTFWRLMMARIWWALSAGASNNLEALSQAVYRATGMIETGKLQSTLPNFPTITAALTHLFEYSLDHRCIFIIDEYPYLANRFRPFRLSCRP